MKMRERRFFGESLEHVDMLGPLGRMCDPPHSGPSSCTVHVVARLVGVPLAQIAFQSTLRTVIRSRTARSFFAADIVFGMPRACRRCA